MVISGILIFTKAGLADDVAKEVAKVSGVEIHEIAEGSKIVISLELDSIDESYKTGKQLEKIPGVLGVNLIYCNFENSQEALDWSSAL